MKFIDMLSVADEETKITVFCDGEEIATYDGRNSIDESLNERTVKSVYAGYYFIGIDVEEK